MIFGIHWVWWFLAAWFLVALGLLICEDGGPRD